MYCLRALSPRKARLGTLGAQLGLSVWCEDEAGPFQAVPQSGASWQPLQESLTRTAVRPARLSTVDTGPAGRLIGGSRMDKATFNCPHCGALYSVTVRQRLAIGSASAQCKACDRVMLQWSTASPPNLPPC